MSQDVPSNATSLASNSDTTTSSPLPLKRNSKDIGWNYATLYDLTDKDKWQCLKCLAKYSGGIHRAKHHIAGIKGSITPCPNSSKEEQKLCLEAIEKVKRQKTAKKQDDRNLRSEVEISELEEIEQMEGRGSQKPPRHLGAMDKYVSNIEVDDISLQGSKARRQQNIGDAIYKKRTLQVHQYLAKWIYESAIPFHAVDNNAFKQFVEAVGQFGAGYQPPSQYLLREPLLKGEVEKMKISLKAQEEEWERNGCSIMTDAWSDRNRRSIMNLCVNSRIGTIFLSSKEASLDAHTGKYIFDYVDGCIEDLGEEKVVQVVTDNASNNMAAAIMLREKRPQIFWTPCATHSLNLMLEAIGKLPLFKKTIDNAKNFTIFIYSHHKTLAMMRKRTQRNIVRPGVTRFATAFLTLQSLLEMKEELRQMVGSKEWDEAKWSKTTKGRAAYNIITHQIFWNGVNMCLSVFTPLVKVLRIVDGDVKPAMGFVYGEMKKAREEIKVALKNKREKYKPILDIVDAKGKGRIDTPLHLTAYMLNPYYFYNTNSTWPAEETEFVMEGVFSCIERFYPDLETQNVVINVELSKYKDKQGAFSRVLATKGCESNGDTYDPVSWWSNYGIGVPNLQKLAMRILSLTTSSSGCERNWSAFEGIHTKKRNRLDTERMEKLVYVQFNARLMNKRNKGMKVDLLLAKEATHAQSWIVEGLEGEDDETTPSSETMPNLENEASKGSRKSARVEEVREVDEDDFESDGTEDDGDDDEEFEFDESNMEREINVEIEDNDSLEMD